MIEILSSSQINQAVMHVTPGVSSVERILLACADTFRKGYLMCRKTYLITHNPISFAAGSALSLALGQNDTLSQVARIILGVLSVLKCGEDLHKLRALKKKCSRIVLGKEYILIQGDRFNIGGSKAKLTPQIFDQVRYSHIMRMERIALLVSTFWEMAVVFGELMLHMGDAYVAFNEECSTEVFIHSRMLWDELSSDQSYLVQQLKNNEAFNDWILERMNTKTSLCTQMLMGLIAIPSQIRSSLPDIRDISSAVSEIVDDISLSIELNIQDCQMVWRKMHGIDPLIHSNKLYSYTKGSAKDPEMSRWIKPPKRINVNKAIDVKLMCHQEHLLSSPKTRLRMLNA